jgi:hypothetical protein
MPKKVSPLFDAATDAVARPNGDPYDSTRRVSCAAAVIAASDVARAHVITDNASPGMKGFAERHGSELSDDN